MLTRTTGLGSKGIQHLLDHLSIDQIFSSPRQQLAELGLKPSIIDALINPDWSQVESDLSWLSRENHHLITITDEHYPELLKQIVNPPPVIFARGNTEFLNAVQIGIVGSRNPSTSGAQNAFDFAADLARSGFVITSGLALGIDASAHLGALRQGTTIAVAGTGLDRVYPARHKKLAEDIVENGLMISEFPPGTAAKANHFPRRNRIISGLCMGLLVVEAAKQSGSLITARLALEQNREVFAIPGSIHNPLARGCNALIKEGAKLVETSEDILEELGFYNQQDTPDDKEILQTGLDLEQQNLLNLVQFAPTSIDFLVKQSGLAVEEVSSMLLVLELEGYIQAEAGGTYTRVQ